MFPSDFFFIFGKKELVEDLVVRKEGIPMMLWCKFVQLKVHKGWEVGFTFNTENQWHFEHGRPFWCLADKIKVIFNEAGRENYLHVFQQSSILDLNIQTFTLERQPYCSLDSLKDKGKKPHQLQMSRSCLQKKKSNATHAHITAWPWCQAQVRRLN